VSLYVQESFVNKTEGYRFGDSDVYETQFDTAGEIYRHAQREYGRCTGKAYVDVEDGEPIPVGWVFLSRVKYEDVNETYLREVWVTVFDKPDTVTRERHYHAIQ
jgi:hypothetical protein